MGCHNFIESGVKSASHSLRPLLATVLNIRCVRCQRVEVCPLLSVDQVAMFLSSDRIVPPSDSSKKTE